MDLYDNIQMLAHIKGSIDVMNDLVEDEEKNGGGILLHNYQQTLKLFEEAYEHKKNIFTQKNISQPNEFTCERNSLGDMIRKMKIRSTLLRLKNECGNFDIINDDEDLKDMFK